MATGGTGDVLAGLLGAWCGDAERLFERAGAGVWVHARAGQLAAATYGDSLIASDVIGELPPGVARVVTALTKTVTNTAINMASVRVPATSANLGPGFDCLGLAVMQYLEVTATLSKRDTFVYSGPGHVADTLNNLTHQGFRAAFAAVGRVAPKVRLEAYNTIPLARGLGSSSAALVAGAALADAFLDGILGREGVFQLTAGLEGHPDNVAPAVFGGFTVSAKTESGYLCQALPLPARWTLLSPSRRSSF